MGVQVFVVSGSVDCIGSGAGFQMTIKKYDGIQSGKSIRYDGRRISLDKLGQVEEKQDTSRIISFYTVVGETDIQEAKRRIELAIRRRIELKLKELLALQKYAAAEPELVYKDYTEAGEQAERFVTPEEAALIVDLEDHITIVYNDGFEERSKTAKVFAEEIYAPDTFYDEHVDALLGGTFRHETHLKNEQWPSANRFERAAVDELIKLGDWSYIILHDYEYPEPNKYLILTNKTQLNEQS